MAEGNSIEPIATAQGGRRPRGPSARRDLRGAHGALPSGVLPGTSRGGVGSPHPRPERPGRRSRTSLLNTICACWQAPRAVFP